VELVEIRDLDGPNLFILQPAMKLEVVLADGERVSTEAINVASDVLGLSLPDSPHDAMLNIVGELHRRANLPEPAAGWRSLDTPQHHVLFFVWSWRSVAERIAELTFATMNGRITSADVDGLSTYLERDRERQNRPELVTDDQRKIPAIGVTGTNGKTTTTRLLSHIIRCSGQVVGWCSSSGVYIDGDLVLDGDYTGPSGARRVLEDPRVDVAVLETARGGILLRGLGYESNDVGVMLNVSADHLDMQGVETIETLAEAKSVVVRVTKASGVVVLNADDPLVAAQRGHVQASVIFFTQNPDNPIILDHLATGGRCIVRNGDDVLEHSRGRTTHLFNIANAPVTFGGRARHMVENVLAATGAALGLKIPVETIADGVATFTPDIQHNVGRLNVFDVDGRIVVVDYAHNESGLQALINFSRSLIADNRLLRVVVGTAGDRQDAVFEALGHVAAAGADRVFLKETPKYLRGRPEGDGPGIIKAAIVADEAEDRLYADVLGEHDALLAALDESAPGDAVAVMCVEEQLRIFGALRDRGAREWSIKAGTPAGDSAHG